jgi:hypothetical protein
VTKDQHEEVLQRLGKHIEYRRSPEAKSLPLSKGPWIVVADLLWAIEAYTKPDADGRRRSSRIAKKAEAAGEASEDEDEEDEETEEAEEAEEAGEAAEAGDASDDRTAEKETPDASSPPSMAASRASRKRKAGDDNQDGTSV